MKTKIILGVTGGIAAYKAADIARRLMEMGLSVHVVMTKSAEEFITPLTFEALTGNNVLRARFPKPGEEPIPHITLPREATLIVVAPATANIIGKMANGIADDQLSTMLIASDLPVIMAPAMNSKMYNNIAVQENMAKLGKRGVTFIGPVSGELACGDEGVGKLSPVEDIVSAVAEKLALRRDLAGLKIIVTTGGTREPVDPVRFIGNRSSGKMGVEIAKAAARRGANATLIAGSVEIPLPDDIETVHINTAEEMRSAIFTRFDNSDALIMTAAVGDYHVMRVAEKKVKKKDTFTLTLAPNPDIIAEMCRRKRRQIVVGFAAETERVTEYGKKKLIEKNMDMIVVNDVSRSDIGFGSDYNEVTIIPRYGEVLNPPRGLKSDIANIILDKMASVLRENMETGKGKVDGGRG